MINLDTLKNDWERLAEHDALWAILTDHTKADGKWEVPEFMATGEAEVETVMNHLAAIDRTPSNAAALDFGCGVGRLTQALARRFTSCVGVDISPQMIQKAESLNRYPHCRYVANSAARLPFGDASFSFIYSNIVLQHMPRPFSRSYLREFVRVLTPGGVLVFGVQESFKDPEVLPPLTRLRRTLRIRSRMNNALGRSTGEMQMHCLPERIVRRTVRPATVVDIQHTNTGAGDFNGKLVYLRKALTTGYAGKQYCVVK